MGRHASFAAEMQKLAGIPTTVALGTIGGGLGALLASSGMSDRHRADEDRHAMGLIDARELKRRQDMRILRVMGGASVGLVGGSLIPAGAHQIRDWVKKTSKEVAESAENSARRVAGEVKTEYSDALQKQVDYAMNQVKTEMPEAADVLGRKAGRGFADELYEASVTRGRRPEVQVKHDWQFPWSRSRGS